MNKLKYIFLAIITAGIISACDDKLDVTNPNAQDSSTYWNTQDDIAEGVIACYTKLLVDGGFMRVGAILFDVRGDDVIGHSSDLLYPSSGSFTVPDTYEGISWPWRDYYGVIYRCNLVLEKAADITFEDEDYKNRLLGQTYFLRAFSYYVMTTMYHDAPLILEVQNSTDEYYVSPSSREDILAQIESDLSNAVSMLPESYDNVSGDDQGQTGRATWGAAAGLLARVYMMQYKWDEAGVVLKQIIDSKLYELVDDYSDNFTYANENNKESLFEIQFGDYGSTPNWVSYSSADWIQGSALNIGYGLGDFGGWSDAGVTWWLYNKYKKERTTDGLLDPRLYWTILSYEPEYDTYTDGRSNVIYGDSTFLSTDLADTITIAKYTHARIHDMAYENDNGYTASTINYRVIRYAEVLLNYAEVLIEQDDHASALTYINMIRDRAGLSIITAGSISNDSIEAQYHHQRSLELAVEGIRGNDIIRWGWFYDNDKLEMLEEHDEEFATWNQGKEYYPYYSGEIASNPNLGGNCNNNSISNAEDSEGNRNDFYISE